MGQGQAALILRKWDCEWSFHFKRTESRSSLSPDI